MKNIILAFIGGLLLALSLPGYFIPFAFLGGFFIIFYQAYNNSLKKAILYSLITGISFSIFSFYWITYAISYYGDVNIFVAVILFILFSIFFSLFLFVPFSVFLNWLRDYKYSIFLAPFLWVLLENLREFIPFSGFPWNLMGYSLSYINPIAQITAYTGIYLLSFLSVFFSVAVYLFIRSRNLLSASLVVFSIAIFVVIYIWGDNRIKNFQPEGVQKKIAVIQGNIDESEKNDPEKALEITQKYLGLMREAAKQDVDLIVLSESAIPTYPLFKPERALYVYFRHYLKKIGVPLISGFDNYYTEGDNLILHNSIFLFDEKANIVDYYNKIKLVPFGEYVPFPFGIFKPLFPYLQGYDFIPGKKQKILKYREFKIIPLICFEAIFPEFVASFSHKGNLIINATNDAWFGNTVAPYQHFEMARVRAIETGRYFVRAANTGISAVITPTGKISSSIGLFKEGIIVDKVFLLENRTFFSQYYYYIQISYVIIFLSLIFVIRSQLWKRLMKK